ncbi:hypothetical protein GcC1_200018 [Golovinomyces cichoracearum]|uniref:Uncharacterized protein n=1 Tax=Golovinomyces cichoracearum TaxID=62708 RepID=A0A420HEP9_9PEZI|nr:hypothetical protein GcC1_200018 [Golovinomyces cichoracearum]
MIRIIMNFLKSFPFLGSIATFKSQCVLITFSLIKKRLSSLDFIVRVDFLRLIPPCHEKNANPESPLSLDGQ